MNQKKRFTLNVQLSILGFLREKEFYGYELKKSMERFMSEWSDIKFGSIYYALEKLAQEGLIEAVRQEKAGSQPARTIYRITEAGKTAFMEMLEENLTSAYRISLPLDVGLFFSANLDRQHMARVLREQAEMMDEAIERMKRHEQMVANHPGVPELALVMVAHLRAHVEAEKNFLVDLALRFELRDLFSGKQLHDYLEADIKHRAPNYEKMMRSIKEQRKKQGRKEKGA